MEKYHSIPHQKYDPQEEWLGTTIFNGQGYRDPTAAAALANIAREEKAKRYRPLIYICSPLTGDIERNIRRARGYCRFTVDAGAIPIAPHLLFTQFLDDRDPDQRSLGLLFALVLLGKCDAIWVFGDHISRGMSAEISKAKCKRMPIRYMNDKLKEGTRYA